MSRQARAQCLKITGRLETCGPLHVGAMRDSVDVDMPLARDGQGRIYVPGTALAGPMRAWVTRHFDSQVVQRLWGFQAEKDDHASRVYVEDAPVISPDLPEEVWDGVGIDRQWGTAAKGIKFDRAVLPSGVTIQFEMSVEIGTTAEVKETRAVIGYLIQALEKGQIGFGAARTRGLGRIKLCGTECRVEDWGSKEGMLTFLKEQSPTIPAADLLRENGQPVATPAPKPAAQIEIVIDWKPDGPVMVKSGQEGIAVDILPFVSGFGRDHVALTLPGSGLKGVFRSHAERIVRTVIGQDRSSEWNKLSDRQRHLAQVNVPLVSWLFGLAKEEKKNGKDQKQGEEQRAAPTQPQPGRGVIEIDTCYERSTEVRALLSRDAWQKIAAVGNPDERHAYNESPLYRELANAHRRADSQHPTEPYFQQAFHVAVDRWTGGAADKFLFNALDPFGTCWEPIRIRIDLDRLPETMRGPAVALLLLLIRDLATARVPIGFGSNRGYGSIKVGTVCFEVAGEAFAWLHGKTLGEGRITDLPTERLTDLQTAWQATKQWAAAAE
jgi:CRISPR/Cas system CSM-associated protein Csm3 (group 7 of RAMP superfamily)